MIEAASGIPFEALLSGQVAGLAAALTIEVYDPTDAAEILAASGTGITEPRPGSYRATRTTAVTGSFLVRWTRTDTSAVLKEEELIVTAAPVTPVDPGTFASLDDLAIAMGFANAAALSAQQTAQGTLLLELASGLITSAVGRDAAWAAALTSVPPTLRVVCIEAAKRVMNNPSGVRSESEQLGQYQRTVSFTDDAHHCALTQGEERMCRRAVYGTLRASTPSETTADDIASWLAAGDITS